MLIVYIDESGDTSLIERGGSFTYTLGCVLIDATSGRQRSRRASGSHRRRCMGAGRGLGNA
jgi:hypothetical protein